MIALRLLVRLVRLPFDVVFLTIDFVRVMVYHAMGLFWAVTGNERPPFGPCAHSSLVEVEGVELSRCPLGGKYGNSFLARFICGGLATDESGAGVAVCGSENVLRAGLLRTAAAGILLLVFWGIVLGSAGYVLVLRYGNPFSAPGAQAQPAVAATAQPLTAAQREEQSRGWVVKGEQDLQAGDAASARLALQKATELDGSSVAAFTALGRACARLEFFGEAQSAYDEALKLSPGNLDALIEAAALARDAGNPQRSLALAAQAVEQAPESFAASLALVQAQRQAQDLDGAAKTAARLLLLRPDDARASQESAAIAFAKGALDEAERGFRRSVELDAQFLDPRLGLAQVLARRGNVDEARQHLVALISQYSADPTPKIELAELCLRTGDMTEAIRLYGEICRDIPNRFLLRARHGELLGLSGRTDEAYCVLQALLKDSPGDAMAHLVLADLFVRRGFISLADEHVTKALAQRPGDAQAYRLRARIVVAQGNMEAAIRILRVLLDSLPQDAELHARLAHCLEQTSDLEEAEKEIGRAIRLRPDMATLYVQLAQLLVRAQRLDEAVVAYRTALEREPRNAMVMNNLALALLEAGRPAVEALGLALKARDIAGGSPEVADTLAWCHFVSGNPQAAEALSAEALRGLADNATVRFHRGMILKALGRRVDAAAELEAALRIGLPPSLAGEAETVLGTLKQP
jgi:tetratricopeptide (TPR) repeat protein